MSYKLIPADVEESIVEKINSVAQIETLLLLAATILTDLGEEIQKKDPEYGPDMLERLEILGVRALLGLGSHHPVPDHYQSYQAAASGTVNSIGG